MYLYTIIKYPRLTIWYVYLIQKNTRYNIEVQVHLYTLHMPKKDKRTEEESEQEEEEEVREVKKKEKKGKKNKEPASTPVKNNKVSKNQEKSKKSKKTKKDDNENGEEEAGEEVAEEKGKKGKKKAVDVKKLVKQVKKEIIALGKKVNKKAYRKHFEEAARDPAAFQEIVDNLDILITQSDLYDEQLKRKPSYRYMRPEVVKFINKYPISEEQPKFKPLDESGHIVGNKITISRVLHAYLKNHCECIKKEGKSRSAFSCISYKLDDVMKKLLNPILKAAGEKPIDILSFSEVSGIVSKCQYNDVNVLNEDIEAYAPINEWFASYKLVKEKGEPKKRGRKPKSAEEKEKDKKKKEKEKAKKKKEENNEAAEEEDKEKPKKKKKVKDSNGSDEKSKKKNKKKEEDDNEDEEKASKKKKSKKDKKEDDEESS